MALAADALRYTAEDCHGLGVAEEVLPEPLGGAHRDWEATFSAVGDGIRRHLSELRAIPRTDIASDRYDRFRKLGVTVDIA